MRRIAKSAAFTIAYCVILVIVQNTGFSQNASPSNINLYFFTNPACGPCRQIEPIIEQLTRQGFPVTTINTNAQPNWVQHFNIQVTPTVIMVVGGKVVNRQSGMIDGRTLEMWFSTAQRMAQPTPAARSKPKVQPIRSRSAQPIQSMANSLAQTRQSGTSQLVPVANFSRLETREPRLPSTVHRGTLKAQTAAELRAMKATVRLQVADPQGTSFATGTIVHTHQGESLVLTCGHVFRDSNGQGTITAEFGFGGNVKKVSGTLISYEAENRDVALIAIRTGNAKIDPITIAQNNYPVQWRDEMFSIGCDKGQAPTIRRTRIKNLAQYNGVNKYDIYGQPVDGRSGGGLFTPGGQLVGVCNARVVDEDEGVYVALDTIYWQIARVDLLHIFQGSQAIATNFDSTPLGDDWSVPKSKFRGTGQGLVDAPVRASNQARNGSVQPSDRKNIDMTLAVNRTSGLPIDDSMEMIVILRSKTDPHQNRTLTIQNPSIQLLNDLNNAVQSANRMNQDLRMAQLRKQMPQVPQEIPKTRPQMRAQSPK